ncbi:MAG: hypothetical protein IJ664_05695 [Clostridia bacterium]|nr:hypothetical protein [Clostridia bacterium]
MKAYRRWILFLLLLLAAGLGLLLWGLRDYNREFRPPRGVKTALTRCIPQDFVA